MLVHLFVFQEGIGRQLLRGPVLDGISFLLLLQEIPQEFGPVLQAKFIVAGAEEIAVFVGALRLLRVAEPTLWIGFDYLLGVGDPGNALSNLLDFHFDDLVLQILSLFVYFLLKNFQVIDYLNYYRHL